MAMAQPCGLCIERLAPARKDRPVWFDLPEMNEARDGVNASAAIVEAVATGELTPAAKLLTKDEARRIAPSKRRDLFIHWRCLFRRHRKTR
jgi:hypothetical protein